MNKKIPVQFEAFSLINSRNKFYSGGNYSPNQWDADASGARIFSKIGPAKARVTHLSRIFQECDVPKIVIFKINEVEILDQTDRVKKVQKDKAVSSVQKKLAIAKQKKASLLSEEKEIRKELDALENEYKI